jgi:PAS domain S-box-containing protein
MEHQVDCAIPPLFTTADFHCPVETCGALVHESNARFREAFVSAPIGMALVGLAGQWLQVNPALCQMLGYSAAELQERTFQDLTHPDDLTADLAYVHQMIAGEIRTYQMEKRYLHKSGRTLWALLSVSLVRGLDGEPRYFISQIQDVTALKQASIALRESEERFRLLIEGARDYALFMLTPDGHVASWNSGATRLKGYTAEAIVGQHFACFYTAEDRARGWPAQLLERALADGYVADEGWRVRSDGSHFWATVVITTLYDTAGNLRGFSKLTRDATERWQAEQALQQERALLEQRVDVRTAELRAANDELARAVRLKDEFLAGMSHELRTPLNAILGRAEMLREAFYGPLTDRQETTVAVIEESGRHLLSLINDVLDLAKIRSGAAELDINTVGVAGLCQSAVRMISQTAALKRISVHLEVDPNVSQVRGDARRLAQILINLLSNAVKFTGPGGQVGITVCGDPERAEVVFTVWDTGIGIAPEDLPRLFQPFTQLDSRLSREYEGTGLGLALVKQLATLHGGSVAVISKPTVGSRFSVTLPWGLPQLGAEPAAASQWLATAPASGAGQSNTGALVLLTEDNESNSAFVCDYLHLLGYQVVVARSGTEALARAIELRPALILMDIQLPDMDGLEVTRRIRAHGDIAATPIVAVTALAMPGDRERCLQAGADDYVSKPISLRALRAAISTQLERRLAAPLPPVQSS